MYFLLKEYVVGAAVLLTVASLGVRQVLTFWEEFEEVETRKLWCICTNSKWWDQTGLHYWFASQFQWEVAPVKTHCWSHSTTNLPSRNAMFMCNKSSSCFLFYSIWAYSSFPPTHVVCVPGTKKLFASQNVCHSFSLSTVQRLFNYLLVPVLFFAFSAAQTYRWQS